MLFVDQDSLFFVVSIIEPVIERWHKSRGDVVGSIQAAALEES